MCVSTDCTSSETFLSHQRILPNLWTYIAFTYDEFSKNGTFVINDTYGYGSFESSFFNKDSQGWIPSSTNADFKIGFGFLGELSCLQIMNKALKIAEIKQLALTCYLDQTYFRPKSCPKDFIKMYDESKIYTNPTLSLCLSSLQDINVCGPIQLYKLNLNGSREAKMYLDFVGKVSIKNYKMLHVEY